MSESQRIFDEYLQYFKDNPGATIADAYRDIENHYAHAKSMRTAMRGVEKRRAWRKNHPVNGGSDDRNGFLFVAGQDWIGRDYDL